MEKLRIGSRTQLGGRIRTVGLVARRRGPRSAERYAVTTADLEPLLRDEGCRAGIHSSRLIAALPVEAPIGPPADGLCTIGPLAGVEDLVNEVIRRFHPERGRIQGTVTALRGAAQLRVGDSSLLVRELVEIRFLERESGAEADSPVLESADSGALVTTWNGHVVGLLVAGSGHTGFVAPLRPFLEANRLIHCTVMRTTGTPFARVGLHALETEAGIASQVVEIERDGTFGLDVYLDEAA
ncbi:MAG TPA: hypothetical protein VEA61_10350 [Allosphingosinicella sp.]|nr:hypothetical protein [Allosphingosinicella sp.]